MMCRPPGPRLTTSIAAAVVWHGGGGGRGRGVCREDRVRAETLG